MTKIHLAGYNTPTVCYSFVIEKSCRYIMPGTRRPDKHTLIFFRYFFIVKRIKSQDIWSCLKLAVGGAADNFSQNCRRPSGPRASPPLSISDFRRSVSRSPCTCVNIVTSHGTHAIECVTMLCVC